MRRAGNTLAEKGTISIVEPNLVLANAFLIPWDIFSILPARSASGTVSILFSTTTIFSTVTMAITSLRETITQKLKGW